ncbi:MAG: electron transport complex subunit RsxD [Gammaproteobacteria bacterium]
MSSNDFIPAPHRHDGSSVSGMMLRVCLALLPGLFCYIWFFGWGIVIQCLLAVVFAYGIEYIMLRLRHKQVALFLKDGSVLVTALLFAFTISPFTPWWISFIGIGFAVIIAKHVYGGIGFNPFNPAMAGYVFVLLSFPAQMNLWPPATGVSGSMPGISDYVTLIFSGHAAAGNPLDAISGATPLNHMKSQLGLMMMVSEIRTAPLYGTLAGKGWEWVNMALLLGGFALLCMRIIKWRIPVAVLSGLFAASLLFHLYDSETYAGPMFHLFAGGTMLGAFFIATDPVTAATTPKGRLIYGVLIGVLIFTIRTWGGYPDGIAFAVLLLNSAVPLINRYTRPRVLGEDAL